MLFRPIHHTFGPHADGRACLRSMGLLLRPWRWRNGPAERALREECSRRLHGDTVLFSTGREALFALLKAMDLHAGEEVIVQAYTCTVVPNAIHAAGGVPVFAEIDPNTLNLTPDSVRSLLSPHTRAVICQHTFGIPAATEKLRSLCDERGILLIEDCAHVLPDANGPDVGRRGHVALLSFGRDKAVSGVTGGAIVCRVPDVAARLATMRDAAGQLSTGTVARLLLYPLLYVVARPLYGLRMGKALLVAARRTRLLLPILTSAEKQGNQAARLRRMPDACASLALASLKRLEQINNHRRLLTAFYVDAAREHRWPVISGASADLPLQKVPLFTEGSQRIRTELKKQNTHLDDGWTGCVICPEGTNLAASNYEPGTDPAAEEAAMRILSLPTHPCTTLRDAHRLVDALEKLIIHN